MRPLLVTALLLSVPVAGCLQGSSGDLEAASVVGSPYPYDADFQVTEHWSHTLAVGPHAGLPVEEIFLESYDGTAIHMGLFRPDVPEGTKVPVIVDAGPYYADGDEPATSDQTHRLGGFLIENFVPHGYAVAQVSIRGTGSSSGCVDYMGDKEQLDLDAVVTALGEAEWSNGNVAMIGRSYDGSTPWEAATFGNPHLKTIVPISGIVDLQQLHFRNGTSESRALSLGALYYSYGAGAVGLAIPPDYTPEEDPAAYARMACAEGPQHAPMGAAGYVTGGGTDVPGPVSDYWATREFTARVLENYRGSIFLVHGLQDWNVRPSQSVDVYNHFEGTKKALLGQWAHNYPDRPDEHENLRWDWAEMLLRWFDAELKGIATDTGPAVEIEDNTGHWRAEPANAWPPLDATWTPLHPSADGMLMAEGAEGSATILAANAAARAPMLPLTTSIAFDGEPLAEGMRISGQPRFHATVRSTSPGGVLYARLLEVPTAGEPIPLGWAQMDLRYHEGGKTPTGYTANEDVVARMEFYPMDVHVQPGSALRLVVTGDNGANLPSALSTEMTITFGDDATTLELPIVQRAYEPSRWDVQSTEVKDESA